MTGEQVIKGETVDGGVWIEVTKHENGIIWDVTRSHQASQDVNMLTQKPGEIIFQASPQIHSYPWQVLKTKPNRQVLSKLKRQTYKELCSAACPHLAKVLQSEQGSPR